MVFPVQVHVLPPAARWVAGLLRGFARSSLLWLGTAMLFNDALRGNPLAQIRSFAGFFLAPEAAAWCVLLAYSARISMEDGKLVLLRGKQRMELAISDIAAIELWRLPVPGPGATLRLVSGQQWPYGLALTHPVQLTQALFAGAEAGAVSLAMRYAQARLAIRRGRLDRFWIKFIVFPSLLAVPAFRLHQNIAYGGGFGEYYTFGLKAYLTTFSLWWAAWVIGVALCAAALRAAIEAGTWLTLVVRPTQTAEVRQMLESTGHALLYLGLPCWLLLQSVW